MIRVHPTSYGRPAVEALRDVLREAKRDDPLAPVTILVPTNYVGVSVRRRLASGELGAICGSGVGVAGINLLTVYRLGELLGAASLAAAGRRPVSNPVVAAAVRSALTETPGLFGAVRDHPSTERSLVRVHRELRDLDPGQLDLVAAESSRAADVVRVHRAVDAALGSQWYDEFDLMGHAVDVARSDPGQTTALGHLVLYLPQELSQAASRLLLALSETMSMTCMVGVTGVPKADNAAKRVLRRLGLDTALVAQSPAHADRVVSVSDSDEEVRAVVRSIVTDLVDGVPLERIAVLYGSQEPYARLLDEQLAAAGLQRNGDAVRTLAETVAGRTALSLLGLGDFGYRRADLFQLLSTAPILRSPERSHLVPVAAWERVARSAGVIAGLDEWKSRLRQHVVDLEGDVGRLERTEPDHPRIAGLRQERTHTADLLDFVEELATLLDTSTMDETWSSLTDWARALLGRYLGDDMSQWPDSERLAFEQIERALDRLAGLDAVEPSTSLTVFRRTLELELDTGLGRVGSLGEGVFVGRVAQALGMEFERLYVVGLAEGTFPARRRDDSLLPDHERAVVAGALGLRSDDVDEQHRFLLAALASTDGTSTLLFPRGDLRRSAERVPSRWLLDTAAALEGQRFDARSLSGAASREQYPWIEEVPSYVAGLLRCAFPSTEHEYDLVTLLDLRASGRPVADHHLQQESAAFGRAVELTTARASRDFTRFDGNLIGEVSPEGVRADVLAPTRLEDWAACPHRYLYRSVFGVGEIDAPESILRISALDKGNLMHEALELFFDELDPDADAAGPGATFTPEHHERLATIAAERADLLVSRGLVGKQIFWQRDRRDILADLDELLRQETLRDRRGRLMGSEVGFGVPGATQPPVPFTLSNGKQVRFRGSIDRLERTPGDGLIVIDYKTGGDSRYRGLSQENPDLSGTKLQLPVYALAARQAAGTPDAAVHAAYWFVTENRGRWRWLGLDIDDQVMQRFDEVVSTIVDGIERGIFPPRPRERDNPAFVECPYCDPDGLGTSELRAQWMRKRHHPELAPYVALAEPEALLDV